MAIQQLLKWIGIGKPHQDPLEPDDKERGANLQDEHKTVVGRRRARVLAGNNVAATRMAKHQEKAKEITKVQESR